MPQPTAAPSEFDEHSLRYPGWRIALASAACVFVSFASMLVYTFNIFLKPLTVAFGWSREGASAAFGVGALAIAACSPLIGHLLDRYPARRIVIPCIAVFGCAFASLSLLTPHLWHLYAVFLVLGIVGNGTAQLAYSRVITTWFVYKRGVAYSMLLAGSAIGAMVLPPIADALIRAVGWRGAYALLGGAVLLIGLPCAWRVRSRPNSFHSSAAPTTGATLGDGLRSRIFWIIVAMLFLVSISQNGAIAHLSALLTDRGIPTASAALVVSSMGAAILVGRLATGWLLDRFFAPRVAFCLLAVCALGSFLLSEATSMSTAVLGTTLIGVGMGGEADVTPYLLARYFGLRSFSTLYALTWTFYAIAGAIGPVLMGRAFDLTGSYRVLLIQLSVATLAAGALLFLLPRYNALPAHDAAASPDTLAVAAGAD
jgi:MFS family permease